MSEHNYRSKYTRTAVVIVRLPDVDDDPNAINALVLNVTDRQIFNALERFVFRRRAEINDAVKIIRRKARHQGRDTSYEDYARALDQVFPPPQRQ